MLHSERIRVKVVGNMVVKPAETSWVSSVIRRNTEHQTHCAFGEGKVTDCPRVLTLPERARKVQHHSGDPLS